MGHVRLGQPPASKKWREIVGYLAEADVSVAELAPTEIVRPPSLEEPKPDRRRRSWRDVSVGR